MYKLISVTPYTVIQSDSTEKNGWLVYGHIAPSHNNLLHRCETRYHALDMAHKYTIPVILAGGEHVANIVKKLE